MPLTPDARPPTCGGFGDKLVECLVLPSALGALTNGSRDGDASRNMDGDADRMRVFEREAALFHRLASAKYDLGWDIPIIGAHDL
jgi:hypothetical protein